MVFWPMFLNIWYRILRIMNLNCSIYNVLVPQGFFMVINLFMHSKVHFKQQEVTIALKLLDYGQQIYFVKTF